MRVAVGMETPEEVKEERTRWKMSSAMSQMARRTPSSATLTVGSDNVFDVYPDRFNNNGNVAAGNSGNSFYGIIPYSTFSPFGFNGRFLYGRVSVGL